MKTREIKKERTYEKQPQNKYDPQLESKREAFQRRLKEKWGDN